MTINEPVHQQENVVVAFTKQGLEVIYAGPSVQAASEAYDAQEHATWQSRLAVGEGASILTGVVRK